MVQISLQCAIVGHAGSSFVVGIDDGAKVSKLKKAIQRENPLAITCEADQLQLFLAKDGKVWLDGADAAAVEADDLKHFPLMDPTLLVRNPKHFGSGFKPDEGQVHVLVVVPKWVVAGSKAETIGQNVESTSVWYAEPVGPEVELSSCDALLAFLESEMISKDALVSRPHILEAESLEFRLSGREEAITTVMGCFSDIIKFSGTGGTDRTKRVIPVCSGISGLGKTRMLEESDTIFRKMGLDPTRVASVIVQYFNGYSFNQVEQSMLIEASFSWRLLHRFFLDGNCDLGFCHWFEKRLPRNGKKLTLSDAIQVIERKLRQGMQDQDVMYLFLGIDEYQKIEQLTPPRKDPKTSLLHELVAAIGDFVSSKTSNLVLLPLFAGTNLGVIASGPITNSSYYVTKRIPMTLLTMDQVFSIVESNASYDGYLEHAQFRRNLFYLGGVPRWVVDYITAVKKDTCNQEQPLTLKKIQTCYVNIWNTYVDNYLSSLETSQLVRLAAFAVSGQTVYPHETFGNDMKWSRLRDTSLCLLVPRKTSTAWDVHIPYSLLHIIGNRAEEMAIGAERDFATALMDMGNMVDREMFDLQPWQSWEVFGACFYAVRINALLVLGHSTVTLGKLLPGTLMTRETQSISVKLVPSRVFRCGEAFGSSTPRLISHRDNQLVKNDWTSTGCIAVNGDGEAGVDIFFALKDAVSDKVVVFVDQRKRQFGMLQPYQVKVYLEKLTVCPEFLVEEGARLVRGVMNCVSTSNFTTFDVPQDCFLLCRDETEQIHGTLAYHPACTPMISINSACKTAIKGLFKGSEKEVEKTANTVLGKRKNSGGYRNSDELRADIQAKRLKVEFNEQYADFSS
ncbi:hypothetical protein DVH05_003276 [Phytophthora capsici]|nr:hypothetical protein DVH05_003276 [Phytophthora capsici]